MCTHKKSIILAFVFGFVSIIATAAFAAASLSVEASSPFNLVAQDDRPLNPLVAVL